MTLSEKELERFCEKFDILENGCWNWIAGKDWSGYGIFKLRRSSYKAHRLMYEHVNGYLASDSVVHHKCENTSCVNPAHLESLSVKAHRNQHPRTDEQMDRIREKARNATHCKWGHEFTKENTYNYTRNGKSWRQCRACGLLYYHITKRMGKRAWKIIAPNLANMPTTDDS